MTSRRRLLVRALGLKVARLFSTEVRDCMSGERVGRALFIPWRGKIHVIGLDASLRVLWVPQQRLTYWKQEIGFTQHPPPDYPSERSSTSQQH